MRDTVPHEEGKAFVSVGLEIELFAADCSTSAEDRSEMRGCRGVGCWADKVKGLALKVSLDQWRSKFKPSAVSDILD